MIQSQTPIWYSKWQSDLDTQVVFGYHCKTGFDGKLAYSRAVRYFGDVAEEHVPEFLFFDRHSKIKTSQKDAFQIKDGVLVCSQAFRDVLAAHELGATRLYEVAIFKDEERTPSGLPPHYLLHVQEAQPGTFVPDRSKNVKQLKRWDEDAPRPDSPWSDVYGKDELAVRGDLDISVDLWFDPMLRRRLFFSNRLKVAIAAAGLKSSGLKLHAGKVV